MSSMAGEGERIERALSALLPEGVIARGAVRLTGGASMETWRFEECRGDTATPRILRRRRPGEHEIFESSVALGIEAGVLRAARVAGVPVAEVIVESDAGELGEAYAMSHVAGETNGRKIAVAPEFASARALLAKQCGAALAALHAMPPPAGVALETLGGRASLDRYEASYRHLGDARPALEAAIVWLRRELPAPVAPVVVHGDFRNGNLMVDRDAGLAAVLDWELVHLGDPAEDLGWFCVPSWRFGARARRAGGVCDLDDLLRAYRAAGGAALDPARIAWWQAFGSFKWAVIAMQMYATFAAGTSPTVERAVIGRRVSECEADLIAVIGGRL